MKALNSLIGSISAFAGILLILIFLVQAILVQDGFLNMTNSKYSVHKSLSMSEGDLQEVVHVMIAYVKGQIDSPDIKVSIHDKEVDFFNEKEVGHLADVRQVIQNFGVMEIILAIVCIVGEVFLVRKKAYKQMIRGVWYAWGILLVAAVVVGIAAVIDVNIIITVFHEVCFTNDNWLLNPAKDRSVWMFKPDMYIDALIYILGILIGTMTVTIGGTVYLNKKIK